MEITQKKIEEMAPNASAAKNGRDLVNKNKFSGLHISPEKDLIWGECSGSGKNPYYCSADYIDEHHPVFRCSCPSRQLPCKHAIGLLYAFEKDCNAFTPANVPEDINQKREKIGKRQEKKIREIASIKEKAAQPKKVNKNAIVKKAEAQLTGIGLAGKILDEIVQTGLSSLDPKVIKALQIQVKALGNYYITGIQTAFNDFFLEMHEVENENYTLVIDRLNYLAALLKKATDYLGERKDNPESEPELDSAIEEQIGYAWKLTELMQYGLYEENAELMQLSFNSYDDPARKEYIDEGIWYNLKSGRIYKTKNYRPYRAAKYINVDNSCFDVLQLKEIFIYPGDCNPRVRWEKEGSIVRQVNTSDLQNIVDASADDYLQMIKTVKQTMKNPLMDKHPVVLIKIKKALLYGKDLVVEDANGNRLTLRDIDGQGVSSTMHLKAFLPAEPVDTALTVMIRNDIHTGLITAQPMCLITPQKLIRLMY